MTHFPSKIAAERGASPALIDEHGETSWQDFNHRSNQR